MATNSRNRYFSKHLTLQFKLFILKDALSYPALKDETVRKRLEPILVENDG